MSAPTQPAILEFPTNRPIGATDAAADLFGNADAGSDAGGNTPRLCRTCASATTEPGHREMYRLRYRNCEHKPAFVFVPGNGTCARWAAKN